MISEYLGIESDYVIIGVAAVSLLLFIILFIMLIVTMVKLKKLKKKYNDFMSGTNAKSLEDTLLVRLNQVDDLIAANTTNEKNIEELFNKMKVAFSKVGLVKYDAFNEMGGKLSFSLALLNDTEKLSIYTILCIIMLGDPFSKGILLKKFLLIIHRCF